MKNAAYGIYRNGQVLFDEPVEVLGESKVVVVFLDDIQPKNKLTDVFNLLGSWEDDRSTDEIISDIRESRVVRADIQL